MDAADEALEHGGDFAGLLDHRTGLFQGGLAESLLDSVVDVELGAEFTAGAFADAEEAHEVTITVTLGAFGDV